MTITDIVGVPGIKPVVELGLGDTRVDVGQAQFNVSFFNNAAATFSGTEASWIDVTCYAQEIEFTLGRERATDRFDPADATLVMDNSTGWADLDPADIATLTMRAGRSIRIGVDHETIGRIWKFRGFVDAITPDYDPELGDIIQVECIDALGEAGRTTLAQLAVPVGANERGSLRINRILDAGKWPADRRQIASTSTTMLATDLGGQVLDLLTQCADSEGGGVFGDLEGRVAYRGKDWQTYSPTQPNDGTIGNGVPAAPATPGSAAYLIAQYGTATTSDTPDMTLPNVFTIVFRVNGPLESGDTTQTIAGQWEGSTNCSWLLSRGRTTGDLFFEWTATGNPAVSAYVGAYFPDIVLPNPVDEYGAVTVTKDNGAGGNSLTVWTSPDGITWTQGATVVTATPMVIYNSTLPVRVGAKQINVGQFQGRIYSVKFRTGSTPTGGNLVWQFDPGGWPGYGLTWMNGNRPWTVTSSTAIMLAIQPTPAEVCPSRWEVSHRRSDIVTQVVLGRDDGGATPQRTYNDSIGQAMYGVETPYSLTDLTCVADTQLDRIADHLFRTRGKYMTPRVAAVHIDASTGTNARDLLTRINVFEPSRYRCRHVLGRGTIFDTTFFATGVTHRITPEEWTARIALDLASPWSAIGARFDQADFDNATFGA